MSNPNIPNSRIEYGVRTNGGHIEAKISRHVATREIEKLLEAGAKNVWLVQRHVTDWEKVN